MKLIIILLLTIGGALSTPWLPDTDIPGHPRLNEGCMESRKCYVKSLTTVIEKKVKSYIAGNMTEKEFDSLHEELITYYNGENEYYETTKNVEIIPRYTTHHVTYECQTKTKNGSIVNIDAGVLDNCDAIVFFKVLFISFSYLSPKLGER